MPEAVQAVPTQYVRLDVGGTRYTTLLVTLTKHPDSMLAAVRARTCFWREFF
jgi:hypothetical protein